MTSSRRTSLATAIRFRPTDVRRSIHVFHRVGVVSGLQHDLLRFESVNLDPNGDGDSLDAVMHVFDGPQGNWHINCSLSLLSIGLLSSCVPR